MAITDWFLSASERGNDATTIDDAHPGEQAWSTGNTVRPLVHGAVYFRELHERVLAMEAGDLLLFTDWRGDPDERLTGEAGSEVGQVLAAAAKRGVDVRGLVWRSHWDKLAFSAEENRSLSEEVAAAGGECLLDMRVRPGGSHHQKFVVLRHPGRPERDVAFLGGIDLCHSRRDDADHGGDPQPQAMAPAYGRTPPWHDVQVAISGPAVADVELVFRERWNDPTPLTRNVVSRLGNRIRHEDVTANPLPPPLPTPATTGTHDVQLLRTYPRRLRGFPFAPRGERSVARGYTKAISQARQLILVEDQYLWSMEVARTFVDALRAQPGLRVVAVLPLFPDQAGAVSEPPNYVGRLESMSMMRAAGGDRVSFYGIENADSTPIYVHAKVCIIDDIWASVGSDNFNLRSWSHDSELSAAVWDESDGERSCYAQSLRLELAREHLGRDGDDDADLVDLDAVVAAFAATATELDRWHRHGRRGPRPPGQLRTMDVPQLPTFTRRWATPLYRRVFDPDGRPWRMRRQDDF